MVIRLCHAKEGRALFSSSSQLSIFIKNCFSKLAVYAMGHHVIRLLYNCIPSPMPPSEVVAASAAIAPRTGEMDMHRGHMAHSYSSLQCKQIERHRHSTGFQCNRQTSRQLEFLHSAKRPENTSGNFLNVAYLVGSIRSSHRQLAP